MRILFVSTIFFIATNAMAQNATPSASACTALTKLQVPGVALSVTKAESFAAGGAPGGRGAAPVNLPTYCRLDGVIDQRAGNRGAAFGIGFAIALPDNWNGRFLMQGGGGLNGSVGAPFGGTAAGSTPALARGFAVASTDTGHQGRGAFDAGFMQDQQASLDFAYAAICCVAEVARRISADHYQKPVEHSYFVGCSTGGREAMLMAQRYPLYFDGIVAGAPRMRTGFSGL